MQLSMASLLHLVLSFLYRRWFGVTMHVYQDEWDTVIGEVLQCRRETQCRHDPYAVAILSAERVVGPLSMVGHMPRKISPVYSIFIQRGGSIHR